MKNHWKQTKNMNLLSKPLNYLQKHGNQPLTIKDHDTISKPMGSKQKPWKSGPESVKSPIGGSFCPKNVTSPMGGPQTDLLWLWVTLRTRPTWPQSASCVSCPLIVHKAVMPQQGVRFLLAKQTRLSGTSDNESYYRVLVQIILTR